MSEHNEVKDFTFIPTIKILFKNIKIIGTVTITGTLLTWIICLFITPEYKSTVTVFPANLSSVSQMLFSENERSISVFGDENESEQLLQIIHSEDIMNRIIDEFDLYKHYNIDTDSKYPKTNLINKYKSNVIIKKTRFMSITIDVYDTDSEIATNIANRISDLIDTVYRDIQKERNREALAIVQSEYDAARMYITQIEDSLNKIRKKGINNYKAESEVYNAAYARALGSDSTKRLKALQQKIDTLSKYGGITLTLLGELELEQKRVALLRDKLTAAQVNVTRIIPRKIVVNKAFPSEKAVFPIIWLTVLLAGISFLVSTSFLVTYFEKFRKK